jgi:hypothetical protein
MEDRRSSMEPHELAERDASLEEDWKGLITEWGP